MGEGGGGEILGERVGGSWGNSGERKSNPFPTKIHNINGLFEPGKVPL